MPPVPIYEFECPDCGSRFEELSSAGTESASCLGCGSQAGRILSSFGTSKQLTPNQRRRLEDRRGTDRGGARERFQSGLDSARGKTRRKRNG